MIRLFIITMISLITFGMTAQTSNAQNQTNKPLTGLYYANEQLADASEERAAFDLMLNLRCIQCQGQSIADSDAPIAEAMRHQVRLQIEQGKKEDEIQDWMIARYGDYVTFEPSAEGISLLLWLAPILFFSLALYLVIPLFRGQKSGKDDGVKK